MQSAVKTLGRLTLFIRPYLWILVSLMGLVITSAALGLAPPWIMRYAVDDLILGGRPQALWWAAALMLGLSLMEGVLSFGSRYGMEYMGQKIVYDLRESLYDHLSRLSFSYFDTAKTGDLMARVTSDTDTLNRFFGFASVNLLSNILTLLGIFVVILIWDIRLALLYLALGPLMYHAMRSYATKVRPVFQMVRRKMAGLTEVVQESIVGVEVVKVFGRERYEAEKFHRENKGFLQANMKAAKISSLWMPYVHVLMGLATGFVIWYGGRLVIQDAVSLGTLVGFVGYIGILLRPIRQTGMMVNVLTQSSAAAERVFEVMDRQPDVQDHPGAYELPDLRGEVVYSNVSFAYQNDKDVLHNIHLTVKAGETVAIVGPTGSGKSTLIHLLPRFYALEQGTITVDGHSIQDVTLKSLRKQIGIVLQDVFLFDGTIAENIAYGKPEATMDDVRHTAALAQLDDFINSLPAGYATQIGERGAKLSGGQKQRLAMARVLLTDPKVLILDEPTSSVDTETETRMQQALAEVMKGRTVFVIAHRLWTVQAADRIVVLKDGQIVETGTHQELLQAQGFYATVNQSQLGGGSR